MKIIQSGTPRLKGRSTATTTFRIRVLYPKSSISEGIHVVQLAPMEHLGSLRAYKNHHPLLTEHNVSFSLWADFHNVLIASTSALLHIQPQTLLAVGAGGQQHSELFDGIVREGKH